jgi:hypothetical protein
MIWGRFTHRTLTQALMVALAVIGAGFDLIPAPVLALAGICECAVEETDDTDAENERDSRSDDPNNLSWALIQLAAPGEKRRSGPNPPIDLPRSSHANSSRLRLEYAHSSGSPIALPIQLCRFTC